MPQILCPVFSIQSLWSVDRTVILKKEIKQPRVSLQNRMFAWYKSLPPFFNHDSNNDLLALDWIKTPSHARRRAPHYSALGSRQCERGKVCRIKFSLSFFYGISNTSEHRIRLFPTPLVVWLLPFLNSDQIISNSVLCSTSAAFRQIQSYKHARVCACETHKEGQFKCTP